MEVFDFIDENDLADLPQDPQQAFLRLVKSGKKKFDAAISGIDEYDNKNHEFIEDARYGFQNYVLGLAKQFKIEPLARLEAPPIETYAPQHYRQFRADLTQYMTQIVVAISERDRSDSVPLLPKSQDSVRQYIHYLREAIDKADLSDAKRTSLHKRLDDLEVELGRNRVRILVVARVLIEILAIPGALYQSYDVVAKLASNIMQEIGEAKVADDDSRRVPYQEPVALLPPRAPEPKPSAGFDRSEMDDEIPF